MVAEALLEDIPRSYGGAPTSPRWCLTAWAKGSRSRLSSTDSRTPSTPLYMVVLPPLLAGALWHGLRVQGVGRSFHRLPYTLRQGK